MNKRFLIVLFLLAGANIASYAQTVYFNGLGRALVTAERFNGNLLTPNPAGGRPDLDTASAKRGTGGYTIFDLGINAQPNEGLRASVILRVKNEFGGFYGDGSQLSFRQMRLDGVISKIVKYEIGDIDLGLTPYTVYNFDEVYHDYEADVFAIRRSVVHYENFNFGNKWRVQGAQASGTLKFGKGIEKIELRTFASRTRRTNFLSSPDRVLYGGRVSLVQSKFIQIGGTMVKFVDVMNTASSSLANYNNGVTTGDYKIGYINDKIDVALTGEIGFSKYSYDTNSVNVTKDDYFYDLGISGKYLPLSLKVFASYRNVGPDFSSPSAQTRRIYDAGLNPAIFKDFDNNSQIRQPGLFDRFTDESMRNLSISPLLMAYLPHYNSITPYGIATPNRKGITAGISYGDNEKFLKADVIFDLLNEAVPVGANNNTRKFTGIKGGALFNLHKLINFEKTIALSFGIRNEDTELGGNNVLDLKSTLIDAGLTWEVYKGLDILGGYKLINARGKAIAPQFNAYGQIIDYTNITTSLYDYNDLDIKEGVMAFGMRYRFGKNSYFTAQGHFADFVNNKNGSNNYNIRQLFLNYTMIF
ncbi:MAG: hypothetical protein K2X86_15345 [Cytophagaceae bacterium]|nr:hypothetical protein [Cytophagaceae bacterium]